MKIITGSTHVRFCSRLLIIAPADIDRGLSRQKYCSNDYIFLYFLFFSHDLVIIYDLAAILIFVALIYARARLRAYASPSVCLAITRQYHVETKCSYDHGGVFTTG